jgi:hypothetical protein
MLANGGKIENCVYAITINTRLIKNIIGCVILF